MAARIAWPGRGPAEQAGGMAIWSPGLPVAVWLPVVAWHVALAVAVVPALTWDLRRNRG